MADCKNGQTGTVQIADKQGTDERINMSITDVMYWLDKMQEKDRLIYTKEEIERLNRQIYCRCLETGDMFDIKEIVKEYSPAVWQGICISRADVKKKPCAWQESPCDWTEKEEDNQITVLLPNEPVVIVRESLCKEWYYLYARNAAGWVRKDCIADCGGSDCDIWENMCKEVRTAADDNAGSTSRHSDLHCMDCDIQQRNGRQPDFYVITASRWRTECNPKDRRVSQIPLYMGTILKKCNGKEFAGIPYNGDIAALFPVKNQNGQYEERAIQLTQAVGAVCGFLPCTAENILKLAFSMLGEVYGWGGSLDSRDCSMMVHDIFACFGICLPKDTTGLQSLKGLDIFMDLTSYSKEEKEQILTRLRPGAVLGFPGHVMIYLGKTGQDYYVISQTGHFYQKTDTGFEKVTVNSCVVNSLSVYRKNEKTWLNSLTYCLLYDF